MIFGQSVFIDAPPEKIFAVYQDVDRWHTWDPDTRSATLNGSFEVGSRGRLVPTKGYGVPMELTAIAEDAGLTQAARRGEQVGNPHEQATEIQGLG